jgi:hypothetical protein
MRVPILASVLCLLLGALTADAEMIANPEYANWSKFKVGTYVTLKTESTNAGSTTTVTITSKLVDLNDEKAVLETSTTWSMPGMEPTTTQDKREVAAKFEKPPAASPDDKTPKPEIKEGEETLEIAGRKIKCKTVESKMEMQGMKITSKAWTSDEVPGMMVKSESKTEGAAEGTSKMTLVEWKAP